MKDVDLAADIATGKPEVEAYLRAKFADRARFRDFALANRNKIRKKVRDARTEDEIEDAAAELKVAYLLSLDGRFSLAYEKYKSTLVRSPDITATFEGMYEFNVEVKRIRKSPEYEGRLDAWHQAVTSRIRQTPSRFGFSLNVGYGDGDMALMDRLEAAADAVVAYCVQRIRDGAAGEHRIPGLEDLLDFNLVEVAGKPETSPTALFGYSVPLLSSGRESDKFRDSVLGKLTQLVPDMPNVIVFKVSSAVHESLEMQWSLDDLRTRFQNQDAAFFQKRTTTCVELLPYWRGLSAALFLEHKGGFAVPQNFLWINPDAVQKLPAEICTFLETMR